VVLLYSLVASGQIALRRLDGYERIANVLYDPTLGRRQRQFPQRAGRDPVTLSNVLCSRSVRVRGVRAPSA